MSGENDVVYSTGYQECPDCGRFLDRWGNCEDCDARSQDRWWEE